MVFDLHEASAILKRTHQTLRSYLKGGQAAGWFRSVSRVKRGVYKVYLSGFFVVARKLGLGSLGAVARVPAEYLSDPKRLATDIAAEEQQEAARWARIRELRGLGCQDATDRAQRGPKRGRRRGGKAKAEILVPTAFELLSTPDRHLTKSSSSSPGGNADGTARGGDPLVLGKAPDGRILYLGERTEFAGVSQAGLGEYLGRAESTIRRRLGNALRRRLGRRMILKRQAAQRQVCEAGTAASNLVNIRTAGELAGGEQLADSKRFFVSGNSLWRCYTNLYVLEGSTIKRDRFRRAKWRRFIASGDPKVLQRNPGRSGAFPRL